MIDQPYLRIDNGKSKPLSECNRGETEILHDQIIAHHSKLMMFVGMEKAKVQVGRWLRQIEERVYFFDTGVLQDVQLSVKEINKAKRKSILSD